MRRRTSELAYLSLQTPPSVSKWATVWSLLTTVTSRSPEGCMPSALNFALNVVEYTRLNLSSMTWLLEA